jgi:hypothetical protein
MPDKKSAVRRNPQTMGANTKVIAPVATMSNKSGRSLPIHAAVTARTTQPTKTAPVVIENQ